MNFARLLARLALGSLLAAAAACTTQPPAPASAANGAILYGYRCKGCHEPATPGAPGIATLAKWETEEIVKSMATGRMKYLVPDMSRQEMWDVAEFITAQR